MFNIFKKPAKLEVHAYSNWEPAYYYTPIVKAHNLLPQWWRDLPVVGRNRWGFHSFKNSNMKTCQGFIDLYKHGLMLTYWNDLVITVTKEGWHQSFQYEPYGKDGSHPSQQWGSAFAGHHQIKLHSPWIVQEKTGTPFLFCPAMWHLEQANSPKIMTGIVNFKYQGQVNINMFLPIREEPYEIRISRGTPLVHLIPLSDQSIDIQNHLMTTEDFMLLSKKFYPQGSGTYFDRMRLIKRADEHREADQKCPFSWLKFPKKTGD